MARSLYKRIYMHFLGLLVAVAMLSSWVFFGTWPGTYLAEGNTRLSIHVARLLVEAESPEARRALALRLAEELDLDVTLYDAAAHVVAQRGRALPRIGVTKPTMHRELGLWFVATPVVPRDEPPLVLELIQTTFTSWSLPLRKSLSLVGFLVMIAFVVRPLARRISRPIERLIEASRRFGDGDLSTRVAIPRFGNPRHLHRWKKRRRGGDELFTLMHAWNDMADRISRQVSAQRELLANVSHELRSPLARIRVALALLPTPVGDGGKTEKRIADIEADLAELDALIEEVLQTSRLEATGLPSHEARFSVSALFEEVLARAAADPLTATLSLSVDPIHTPSGVYLVGDCALLRRALFNLVENAAKYGTSPVTLALLPTPDGGALSVTDHGAGIATDDRERVVRPFARGDLARTPGRSGVGLGLSFASRVAAVHGGTLRLEDPPHPGLRVALVLPSSRFDGLSGGAIGEQLD